MTPAAWLVVQWERNQSSLYKALLSCLFTGIKQVWCDDLSSDYKCCTCGSP